MRVSYLTRAVARRWRVAAVAVASGLLVAAVAHPDWGVHDFSATHRLYSPAAARGGTAGQPAPLVDPFALKPDAIAALATSRQTAARVAARLGFDGNPLRLIERVRATADASAGTIEVTARRRGDPAGAVAIADTVAKELIVLVDESRAGARDQAINAANDKAAGLQQEMGALDLASSADRARREELTKQYAAAVAEGEQLAQAGETSGISTIKPAVARQLPSRAIEALPPLVGWLLTLLLLSGLGAGLAVAVDLTDDRVSDQAGAEAVTGLPVLSVIPPDDDGSDGDGHVGAAHVRLQAALSHRAGPPPPSAGTSSFVVPKVSGAGRVVLFTSPLEADGRTDTVVNFASAVAATGRTALIVDCDTVAPGSSESGRVGEADSARGVGDLAAEGIVLPSLSSLVQPTSMPRVSLVPRGDPDAAAAHFLVRHEHLVRTATSLADVVILHGPPILDGDDAIGLARLADDTVLICRSGETRVADARRAAGDLYDAEASAGVVVIGAAPSAERIGVDPAELLERVRTDAKLRGRMEWAGAGVAMLVFYVLLRSLVFESFAIPTPSMAPYLEPGDHILVSKISYRMHPVHRGDVVVFKTPKTATPLGGNRLVKRVIALPGETVESKDGHILVNGQQLPEKYLAASVKTDSPPVKRQTVPAGRYWVMGDNRGNSSDSRFFGAIPRGSIVGRAFFHLWPTPIGFM